MKVITKIIPAGTKVYATLANCCRHQTVLPGGAQPVFDAETKKPLGFAALSEKLDGSYVYWTKSLTAAQDAKAVAAYGLA